MNMFRKRLKTNVKEEFVQKEVTHRNFKEFIIVIIKIDDD